MNKTAIWISVVTLLVSIFGLVPAYYIFFDKPDLVYEIQVVNIPLPKDLPGQLPDSLAIVTIQNIGRRPSADLVGSVSVGGELIEYQVEGPNPGYGQVSYSRNASAVAFSCSRLAPGAYPIRVSAWYKGANSGPDVGVSDARGSGRLVTSIAAQSTRYREVGSGVLGVLVGLLGSFATIWTVYRAYAARRSIDEAVRKLKEHTATINEMTAQIGTMRK